MTYVNIIIPILLIISAYYLSKIDNIDRTHPFGTDRVKNEKYANKKIGEEYGANTYWGKPGKKDDTRKHIDKIQWLTNSHKTDVQWRRCFFVSVVGSILGVLSIDSQLIFSPRHIISVFLIIFISSYMSINYYIHHFLWRRAKFVDTHVQKLKGILNMPQYNRISQNPLI